jgi:hypothetical protein
MAVYVVENNCYSSRMGRREQYIFGRGKKIVSSFRAGFRDVHVEISPGRQICESRILRGLAGGITLGQQRIEAMSEHELIREDDSV